MNQEQLKHFRELLVGELRRHARNVSDEQATAIDAAGDGAKESSDLAQRNLLEDVALTMGARESQMVADIDQALMRIDEGSYGLCVRCGKPISEKRLEAMPTARYDAECQTALEQASGKAAHPTL